MTSEPLSHYTQKKKDFTVLLCGLQSNEQFFKKNKKTCKSCKGPTVKANFAAFFKEITFQLRYALGMRQLLRQVPFLFVLIPNRGIRNASWRNGDYMLVWHDVISIVYFLLSSLDKDPNYLSCCQFLGLKGSNHVAGCVFYTFFPILASNRLVHCSNN